jgi:hypothetical protein
MLHAEMTVLTPAEINVIFCCVPDLHSAHDTFVSKLQPLVESWTDNTEVAESIKVLVSFRLNCAFVFYIGQCIRIMTIVK